MTRRSWLLACLIGAGTGLVIAAAMSFVDWRHNPGGIFHGELGTNWDIVLETAVSWFVPVAFVAAALSAVVLWWFSRP